MMARTMQFTLRGLPKPPCGTTREKTAPEAAAADTSAEPHGTSEPRSGASIAPVHRGWIDLLLGDTSLESIFDADEQGMPPR